MMPNLGKLQKIFETAIAEREAKLSAEASIERNLQTAKSESAKATANVLRAQKTLAQGFKITSNRATMAL